MENTETFFALIAIIIGLFVWQQRINKTHFKKMQGFSRKILKLERALLRAQDKQKDCEARERRWIKRHRVLLSKYYKLLELANRLILDRYGIRPYTKTNGSKDKDALNEMESNLRKSNQQVHEVSTRLGA
jgi:hypothetical protein